MSNKEALLVCGGWYSIVFQQRSVQDAENYTSLFWKRDKWQIVYHNQYGIYVIKIYLMNTTSNDTDFVANDNKLTHQRNNGEDFCREKCAIKSFSAIIQPAIMNDSFAYKPISCEQETKKSVDFTFWTLGGKNSNWLSSYRDTFFNTYSSIFYTLHLHSVSGRFCLLCW